MGKTRRTLWTQQVQKSKNVEWETQRQTGWKTSLDVKPLVGHPRDYEELRSATQAEIKEQICGNPYSQHSNGLQPKAQVHLSKRVDRSSLPYPSSACALYLCMCVCFLRGLSSCPAEGYTPSGQEVTLSGDGARLELWGRWRYVCASSNPTLLSNNVTIRWKHTECSSPHIWTKQSGDLIFQGDGKTLRGIV